jgi:predicted TIM-barrel fold metal-dependent hydrolase
MPVIDFHVHPLHYETYQPSARAYIDRMVKGDMDQAMEAMSNAGAMEDMLHENGVDYAVILAEQSPITTGIMSNEAVAELCKGREMLIPFCSVNPALVTSPADELERLVGEMGFQGLKLYPTYQHFYADDRRLYPLYARAQDLGIPVMIHTGSSVFHGARLKYGDPIYLDDVAVDFPELTLLAVHSGRGFWYDAAFFLAQLHPNLYMEIAGLPPQRLLDYFPRLERLADKVIFGSDWPGVPSIRGNIEAIRALPLKDETKAKILGVNAARILGI